MLWICWESLIMSYSQQFQEHTSLSYLYLLYLLFLNPHPVLLQGTVFFSVCIPAESPGHPSHSTLVPQPSGDCLLWVPQQSERRGIVTAVAAWAWCPTPAQHVSSRVMNLKNEKRQHADAPPAASWIQPFRPAVFLSVLLFLNEIFAQDHKFIEERSSGSVSKPTCLLAAVNTGVVAHCPSICLKQVLHVPTTC